MAKEGSAENTIRDIKRKTRRKHSAEGKTRIVIEGLRGEDTIAELCRREGIAESLYYSWSKEFLGAGKNRLAGDTARQATAPVGFQIAHRLIVSNLIPPIITKLLGSFLHCFNRHRYPTGCLIVIVTNSFNNCIEDAGVERIGFSISDDLREFFSQI